MSPLTPATDPIRLRLFSREPVDRLKFTYMQALRRGPGEGSVFEGDAPIPRKSWEYMVEIKWDFMGSSAFHGIYLYPLVVTGTVCELENSRGASATADMDVQ